jgi:hypothetical protein
MIRGVALIQGGVSETAKRQEARGKQEAEAREKNKGGRPPKLSVEEFTALIDGFITHCRQDLDIIPSDYALLEYIRQNSPVSISPRTLDSYYTDTSRGYCDALKRLIAYREHRLLQRMQDNPRETSGCIFTLKQARSGGYIDRQQVAGNGEIEVVVKLDTFKANDKAKNGN